MRYTRYSTANDVMKEFLIYAAQVTDMGFPKLPAVNCYPSDSVDFQSSLSRSLKGHRKLNVNFYIEDYKIQCLWNNIDKYIAHLSYFESVCGLNYSIDTRMPLVMQMWNKYRNMAVDWYLTLHGIVVVPGVYRRNLYRFRPHLCMFRQYAGHFFVQFCKRLFRSPSGILPGDHIRQNPR